jgi:hypothetical protein
VLQIILIGVGLVAVTVLIHAFGTAWWARFLIHRWSNRRAPIARVMVSSVVALLLLHILEVMVWAVGYRVLVPIDQLETFEAATYFSLVTFTTLGYGDITLGTDWRLLSGLEALNGILLVGWTTALLFAIVQRLWSDELKRKAATRAP